MWFYLLFRYQKREARNARTALTDRRIHLKTKKNFLTPFFKLQVLRNPDVNLCQKQKRCLWQAVQCASSLGKVFRHGYVFTSLTVTF
jgi:hypothetical protein